MKILQWTLAFVGMLALAALAIGFLLPPTFEVSRSIVIRAPETKIYDAIADPRRWAEWSVWTKRDPQMDLHYSGAPFGQGAKWSWKSRSEGNGAMEFTRVEPNRRVEYALVFPDYGMRSAGEFRLEPQGEATRVTWTNRGDVGANPLKHYLAAAMDRLVGPDFEAGLANLKSVSEKT
ncbi:MAG TPA: SRPBCC family protein [Usitatibacter sp.]|nr:SRPBCC family protein [Usitatibacter sp.]